MNRGDSGPEGIPPGLEQQLVTAHAEEAAKRISHLHNMAGSLETGAGKTQEALEELLRAFGEDSDLLGQGETLNLRLSLEDARQQLHTAHMVLCRADHRAKQRLESLNGGEGR